MSNGPYTCFVNLKSVIFVHRLCLSYLQYCDLYKFHYSSQFAKIYHTKKQIWLVIIFSIKSLPDIDEPLIITSNVAPLENTTLTLTCHVDAKPLVVGHDITWKQFLEKALLGAGLPRGDDKNLRENFALGEHERKFLDLIFWLANALSSNLYSINLRSLRSLNNFEE